MGNFPAAQECSPSHFLGLEEESGERGRVRELRLKCVASAPFPVPGVRNDRDPQQESQKGGRLPGFPPAKGGHRANQRAQTRLYTGVPTLHVPPGKTEHLSKEPEFTGLNCKLL